MDFNFFLKTKPRANLRRFSLLSSIVTNERNVEKNKAERGIELGRWGEGVEVEMT